MFTFLIYSLVCWRISYMLTEEDGPFDLVYSFRNLVNASSLPVLECFKCTSVWVALPLAFMMSDHIFATWLALSAVAIFLNAIYEGLQGLSPDITTSGEDHGVQL
jgi:hypothetical protein